MCLGSVQIERVTCWGYHLRLGSKSGRQASPDTSFKLSRPGGVPSASCRSELSVMFAFLPSAAKLPSLRHDRQLPSDSACRAVAQTSSCFARGAGCARMRRPRSTQPQHGPCVSMIVDPWSVSPQTLDVLAAQFFAASLVPYLGFLYFLERPQNETPPLAAFGFRFLLVFVFATIPAGIYAKVRYCAYLFPSRMCFCKGVPNVVYKQLCSFDY